MEGGPWPDHKGGTGLMYLFFIDREFLLEAKRDRSKLLHAEESGARGGIFSLGIKMEDN